MTTQQLRTIALVVKTRIGAMQASLSPAFIESDTWNVSGADEALPSIGAVKAVLATYEGFTKPPLMIYDEARALKAELEGAIALSGGAYSVDWENVLNKPATFPADAVTWAGVTEKPVMFTGKIAIVAYTGNGAATRVLSFTGAFLPVAGIIENAGTASVAWEGQGALSGFTTTTVTTTRNLSGYAYRLVLWG